MSQRSFTHGRLLVTGAAQSDSWITAPFDGWIDFVRLTMVPRVSGQELVDSYCHAWVSFNVTAEAALLATGMTPAAQILLYVAVGVDHAALGRGDSFDRAANWEGLPIKVQRAQQIFTSGVGSVGGTLEVHTLVHFIQQ